MKQKVRIIAVFCVCFFISGYSISIYGDIYIYIDHNGCLHFTDAPTTSKYKVYIKEQPELTRLYSLDQYDGIILKASEQYEISVSLLKALIKAESDFDPQAVSRTGAKGLMQIMPDTARALQIKNPFSPEESILGGAKYLKGLLVKFEGNIPMAIAAYNAGSSAVVHYKGIPPFKETERFVEKVMTYYRRLRESPD